MSSMVSEVCPRGKEFLFFAFFGIVGNTSSFVGPFVSAASINASGNDHMPFAFLFASAVLSVGVIACVNPQKSRLECSEYLKAEQAKLRENVICQSMSHQIKCRQRFNGNGNGNDDDNDSGNDGKSCDFEKYKLPRALP